MMSALQRTPTRSQHPNRHAVDDAAAPLAPHTYLQLRRKAAGLSVEDLATRLFGGGSSKTEFALYLIRALETPGHTARFPHTLDALRGVLPFDPDVYRQLANEPADRHPRVCRGCGCSHWDPCDRGDQGACAWANDTTCTRCAPDADPAERHQ